MLKHALIIAIYCTATNLWCSDDDGFFGANRTYKGPYKEFESEYSLGPDDLARLSEPQYRLGDIDTLVLKKLIAEKGWDLCKAEIEPHEFKKAKMVYESSPTGGTIERGFKILNPYVITQLCVKDASLLSKKVFGHFIFKYQLQTNVLFPHNPLNAQQQDEEDRIDYCTSALLPDGITSVKKNLSTDTVKLITMFFDKTSLLAALEALKQ